MSDKNKKGGNQRKKKEKHSSTPDTSIISNFQLKLFYSTRSGAWQCPTDQQLHVQNKIANEAVLNAIEEFKTLKKTNPIEPEILLPASQSTKLLKPPFNCSK